MFALGDVPASTTLYVPFATFGSNSESITMSGFATSDILVYKNGSITQRSSTNGFTLLDTDGIDFDGITGIHGFSIDLSDNTDAGFYSVGGTYWIVISSITVNAQTVNFVAAHFRICAAETVTGKPKVDVDTWNGTAVSSPATAGIPDVNVKDINNVAAATPGASGGILISGSNAGTTTLGALTVTGATTLTGNVSMAAGLNITQSSSNTSALVITGNGTGHGIISTSGSGATGNGAQFTSAATAGDGMASTGSGTGNGATFTSGAGATGNGLQATSNATNGHGLHGQGKGTGTGIRAVGGATGSGFLGQGGATSGSGMSLATQAGASNALTLTGSLAGHGISITPGTTGTGINIFGGATSGPGISISTTSGNGISVTPTAGHGLVLTANGTDKHGMVSTGGTAGTSDGASFIAGTGGISLRAPAITANITGTITTATNVTTVNGLAADVITATSIAANALTAAKIATDAIGAAQLAADAVAEIQSGLSTVTTAQVKTQVVAALATDTYAEPGQEAPAATTTLANKINYIFKMMRNKKDQTSTTFKLYADDASTVDQKATVSDDGTTAILGELASGP